MRSLFWSAIYGKVYAAPFRLIPTSETTAIGSIGGCDKDNQDRLAVVEYFAEDPTQSFKAFALADGVGGLEAGGECAEVAIGSLISSLLTPTSREMGVRLGDAFRSANAEAFSMYKGDSATTLTVLAVSHSGRLIGVSVGDSRIYRYSSSSSPTSLDQVTEDDTIGNEVALARGDKGPPVSPKRISGQLTQAIGSGPEIVPNIQALKYNPDDKYILTSDGFHSAGVQNLHKVLEHATAPLQALERIAHMARWLGTKDDVSGILISSRPTIAEAPISPLPPGGLLRIHSLSGTFVFPGIQVLRDRRSDSKLRKPTEAEQSKGKDKRGSKKTSKREKYRKRKPKGKNGSGSKQGNQSGDDRTVDNKSPPQQELEINYISEDKE